MGRYQEWLLTLADDRKSGTSLGMWLAALGVVTVLLAVVAYVPPVAGWFQLSFWPALYAFLPNFSLGVVAGWLDRRGKVSLRMHGTIVLCGCGLSQFFSASLIALSRPPGSFALASLLILTLAFHAYQTRVSFRYPFLLGPSLLAQTAAILLNPDSETLTVMSIVVPVGVFISFVAGRTGLREHHDQRQREKLRQAIYYQALTDRTHEAEEVSERLVELLRANHDAANVLSTIFVHAQLLSESLGARSVGEVSEEEAHSLRRLLEQLGRLKDVIESGHHLADDSPELETAPLDDVIAETIRDCEALFPTARVALVTSKTTERVRVKVHGGATGLRRAIENLVHNACEGDGDRAATSVRIVVSVQHPHVRIQCIDDGPGFRPEQLEASIEPFATTKPYGDGLGLYSILRLVRVSGGSLRRSNHEDGGAVVELSLQQA